MTMRKWIGVIVPVFFVLIFFMYQFGKEPVKESIIFFPIDNRVQFTKAATGLSLSGTTSENYTVKWRVLSETNAETYLRQDISLLYRNGALSSTQNKWKQDAKTIDETKKVPGQKDQLYQGVSFHYAEIHKNEDTYRSAQAMSGQNLYVWKNGKKYASFQNPATNQQRAAKTSLDVATYKYLQQSWSKAKQFYNVNGANYYAAALNTLHQFQNSPIPGYNQAETNKIIGNLWEGLYKNYFLGVKKNNGTTVSPLGSSMPLILFSKDKTNVIVLFQLKDGEFIQLIQYTR